MAQVTKNQASTVRQLYNDVVLPELKDEVTGLGEMKGVLKERLDGITAQVDALWALDLASVSARKEAVNMKMDLITNTVQRVETETSTAIKDWEASQVFINAMLTLFLITLSWCQVSALETGVHELDAYAEVHADSLWRINNAIGELSHEDLIDEDEGNEENEENKTLASIEAILNELNSFKIPNEVT